MSIPTSTYKTASFRPDTAQLVTRIATRLGDLHVAASEEGPVADQARAVVAMLAIIDAGYRLVRVL